MLLVLCRVMTGGRLRDARWLEPRGRWRLSPAVLALLAVGLVVRLLWVLIHPVQPVSDFDAYHQHAATLAADGTYGYRDGEPGAYWAPGWPVLLAGLYLVLGAHPQLGALLGVTLEWGAIAIAAATATRLLRPGFAAGAAAAMCFYPAAIAYGPVLGAEHLTAPLFTGLVCLVAFARPSLHTAAVAGLLGGALLLVRAEFGVTAAVVIAVWLLRGVPRRRVPALGAMTLAGALVFVAPWTARNALTFGEFIPASAKGGLTFYLATVAPDYSEPPVVARLGVTSTTDPGAHDRMWWRRGLENVGDDPPRWLAYDLRRIYSQYGEESEMLHWGGIEAALPRRVALAYWLVVVAFALLGLATIVARRRRLDPAWSYIAGSILAVSLLKLAFIVNERDRLPLTYLLIVVAGLGAQQVADAAPGQRRPSAG
jgi:hypothetical protein